MDGSTKILIVDDDPSNRIILKAQISKLGYKILEASDGEEALSVFDEFSPDIIFMDVIMPVMDGYEATTRLKKKMGDKYVPIIFLTGLTDEENIVRCLDVGGDEFLIKPVSFSLLKSKLQSVERVRQLNKNLHEKNQILLHDEQLAEELFSSVIMADNTELDKLGIIYKPAKTFSGDLILSSRSPSGDFYIMLGDFTGHGLNAAIGALPVSQMFNSMTKKGYSLQSIICEINKKLYDMLPDGMFCAAGFISISADVGLAQVWNSGLPDIIIYNAKDKVIKHKFKSSDLALGIENEQLDLVTETFNPEEKDCVLIMSDGVIEARNIHGDMYGYDKLDETILNASQDKDIARVIEDSVMEFSGNIEQTDDISLVAIQCNDNIKGTDFTLPNLAKKQENSTVYYSDVKWQVAFNIFSSQIRTTNPIPTIINQIEEFENLQDRKSLLFTVISELYNNALDHGLLNLDSDIKSTHEGFENYFGEKESRLNRLEDGYINIKITSTRGIDEEALLVIEVEDSGNGFDVTIINDLLRKNDDFSGRGIPLVNRLCESLSYCDEGKSVEAVFSI